MVGDATQHVAEMGFRLEAVRLGRFDEALKGGGAIGTPGPSRRKGSSCARSQRPAAPARPGCCRGRDPAIIEDAGSAPPSLSTHHAPLGVAPGQLRPPGQRRSPLQGFAGGRRVGGGMDVEELAPRLSRQPRNHRRRLSLSLAIFGAGSSHERVCVRAIRCPPSVA